MVSAAMMMRYLLGAGIIMSVVVTALMVYGNALSIREDDELYLNKAEQVMMAAEQATLVHRMQRLAHTIVVLGIFAAIFLLASAGIWVWIGLSS